MLRVGARRATIGGLAAAAVVCSSLGVAGASPASGAVSPDRLKLADQQPVQDGATLSAEVSAQVKAAVKAAKRGTATVVVKLKDDSLAAYDGGVAGLPATNPDVTGDAKLDPSSPDSKKYLAYVNGKMAAFEGRAKGKSPRAKVTRRLDVVVGGVAMTLPAGDVAKVAADPAVKAVYVDTLEQLQTEATPQFIGAPAAWAQAGGQEKAGEGAIIGVIDSGIWPAHPSLSDPDPSGKAYPAPRPRVDGLPRACDFGKGADPGPAFTCNNKLIGAYTFLNTYAANVGLEPGEFTDATDSDGHGTHTATTAAGNAGVQASIFGVPRGTVSGIAPRAHVIAYRVCALAGCFGSDTAAAAQQAIKDGVDAINYSISGGSNPYSDLTSLAFLDAYNAGVFIAASAGNSGPGADTTDHREPWVTTVAASTGPRSFVGSSTLTSTDGATLTVSGATIAPPLTTPAPVVDAGAAPTNDPACLDDTADGAFAGKVVVCARGGGIGRVQKGINVKARGAVGMILFNNAANITDLETDNHFLPAVHVQFAEGQSVVAFLAAHPGATATITSGTATPTQGDVMASFSSRGGTGQALGISKPDVTAPGVQILAGHTPVTVDPATGPQGELFQAIAGTSMSSPHVAGAGTLLAALHPTWTPGQIHSALMTTATTATVKEDGVTPTDAFDDGSGRINLATARDPYFTIDETGANFLTKQASLYTANYPSLYVPVLSGSLTVDRTLKSVSRSTREYKVSVSAPKDLKVRVSSSEFSLRPGASRTLRITVDGKDVPIGQTRFATITFKSGKRSFTFPVTVVRKQGPVEVTKTCAPATVALKASTTCTVSVTNNTVSDATVAIKDVVPDKLKVVNGSVVGGTNKGNTVTGTATIPARLTPKVAAAVTPGSTPAGGYVPLSAFGIAPVAGVGDETITNFNVPAFTLAGLTYTRIGVVSNGYVVLGGGTQADVEFANLTPLPNAARPNNVLAPFWTDLDGSAGGAVRVGTLTDGVSTWLVVDYTDMREFSTPAGTSHSFQTWIGLGTAEDVTMAYGTQTGTGDGGALTVGVENPDGTNGEAVYYSNGGPATGTIPGNGTEIKVTGTPGQTFSADLSFTATGKERGSYVNYAEVTGPFDGTAIARFAGSVTR